MSDLGDEFGDIYKSLRKEPAYKDGQAWAKNIDVFYRSPPEMRPKINAKYLDKAENAYYRDLAVTLLGK